MGAINIIKNVSGEIMIRVYLSNFYDKEYDAPSNVNFDHVYNFYGYKKTKYGRGDLEITDIVTSIDIDQLDFYIRKEPSKARMELIMNESILDYTKPNSTAETHALVNAMQKNAELLFNNNSFRLGSIITIADDDYTYDGELFEKSGTSEGTVYKGTRNDDGSFTFSNTGIYEKKSWEVDDYTIFERSKKIFVGRITEMNNDNQRIQITVENCIYEFRNVYREFYPTLAKYVEYDPKTDTEKTGLMATAGQIINVCKSLITQTLPINSHRGKLDTELIYDDKYKFFVPTSAVLNKSSIEIMQWALQQYWKTFLVKNKLSIKRVNNSTFNDIFEITSDNVEENTEKLAYSYPVIKFNYNIMSLDSPVSINSLIISTFYESNFRTIDQTEPYRLLISGFNVTKLNADNIVSYKYTRSTKNIVNSLHMLGTKTDDKKNITVLKTLVYPNNSGTQDEELFYRSQIKYGIHRLTRAIDLIDNEVSLETFAKDIGSILAEPDYGLTVNIVDYRGINLNDAVYLEITGLDGKVYEVKNITYKISNGKTEATLDLKPIFITMDNNKKSNPSTIHNTGK